MCEYPSDFKGKKKKVVPRELKNEEIKVSFIKPEKCVNKKCENNSDISIDFGLDYKKINLCYDCTVTLVKNLLLYVDDSDLEEVSIWD